MSEDEADRADGAPHPRQVARLVGHGDAERALLEAYQANRLPHAIILGGPPGIGKATLAWRLAKFLIAHPEPRMPAVQRAATLDVPVDQREVAQVIAMAHPDVTVLRRQYNEKSKRFFTEIRTDDVRRAIGLFQRAAGAGGYRICIVDAADDLNRSSANALLKLIEEPPPASLFVLVAHRPGLVLPTIRSRSRLIRLGGLGAGEVGDVVRGLETGFSEAEIAAAADHAQGSVREALRLLQVRGVDLAGTVRHLLTRLPAIEWREIHKLADSASGRDGDAAYETILTTVFDWLAATTRESAVQGARRLARYAEVWEKVAEAARETDALNLDRRPLILSMFSDLAAVVRASSA